MSESAALAMLAVTLVVMDGQRGTFPLHLSHIQLAERKQKGNN